ncbi:MAG TPA: helix-turn-helix transcriptional regulator [Draconibacterium sp.]|jgi:transcriptional regulator with XRE-family HTH domain|nr:helix-turn-helix transcriptional regulator [Draconibacterium sp.]
MKSQKLEERRKGISKEVDLQVRMSFDIVDRVHEILVKQRKDQKALANLLGKKESEISKWMRGSHNFTISTLAKIEIALGEPVIQIRNETATSAKINLHSTHNTDKKKTIGKKSADVKKMIIQEPENNYQINKSKNH